MRRAPSNHRPDDKAGKYPHLNPYLYCAANPLRYVDPTGNKIVVASIASDSFKETFKAGYQIMVANGIDGIITALITHTEEIIFSPIETYHDGSSAKTHYDGNVKTIF